MWRLIFFLCIEGFDWNKQLLGEEIGSSYDIAKIIASKKRGKREVEWLVHWKGYDLWQSTWEPRSSFLNESMCSLIVS